MNPTFGVNVAVHPAHTVVRVDGDLDMDTCPWLATVTDALTLHGRILMVDLSGVTFMDSSALHTLLTLRNRTRAEHAVLELLDVPAQGRRLLAVTGARGLFLLRPAV
ncbi:STAS domain-containing protein [Streptomyces erythrochromogenes]|uniref:STAS domain-containing protein n=1 Tax=Streptomyces erythrochromogenes TaxID=285574 RepID=UPI0036B11797